MDNDEAQQNSPSTDTMLMVSPYTVPNTMKCKHSLQNELGGNPRGPSVSTYPRDTGSLKAENIHESRESTLVNQGINNASQIKQQDVNSRVLTESHSGYNFRHHTISNCKSSSPDYIPGDQQHDITVFKFDCAPTPSQQ
ncbi:hypothetical protein G6F46_000282 [Rhizopus delemar]|uniref:Uncharacterized protein n=2 Tax=Rhizopus TaxID=4842 RepID=A0A9P7CUX3_9FUNG|nr:hypothetical protein G6F43_010971 [Rhizopus delemar]KAG1167512.1 hypothetical protein G6F36_012522 [Rhizopus arrhizus]KAG1466679.1 hypothetical protein G6F55_000330 [Rhizopus delemar]KAG1505126.1 hypothetical protein G6F54_000529 [Rhizopus delemar]KAG1518700.1 hypothetical protein G6F53_000371 [Rhizopus delemar]